MCEHRESVNSAHYILSLSLFDLWVSSHVDRKHDVTGPEKYLIQSTDNCYPNLHVYTLQV